MDREEEKSAYQLEVFDQFLSRAPVKVETSSIRTGNANAREPDVLCVVADGTQVGFELGRITDPTLAALVNQWEPKNAEGTWTTDPSVTIVRRKLGKRYQVSCPVELILYTEQPLITPDDVLLPTIQPECQSDHGYSRIWFMGQSIEVLYPRS